MKSLIPFGGANQFLRFLSNFAEKCLEYLKILFIQILSVFEIVSKI